MNLHKEYIDTSEPNVKIKFTITFNKETYNWVNGKEQQKGYKITAVPVEKEGLFEVTTAFTGFYEIIYPVERQSKKRLQKAIDLLHENMDRYLAWFEEKGYTIEKSEIL